MVSVPYKICLGLLAASLGAPAVFARNVFHFGDSYSSTGFDPTGNLPSTKNPLGNPDFPGFTIWGGENFIGDFIQDHSTSGGSPTLVYNYAYPGAVVNNSLEHGDTSRPDFVTQFSQFQRHKSNLKGNEDVVSIYFGTNDVNAFRSSGAEFPDIIRSLVAVMGELYDAGARRFIVFSMDPIWRVPAYGKLPTIMTIYASVSVLQWNLEMVKQLAGFRQQHSDANVKQFDTMSVFNRVIDDPKSYGAPDATCMNKDTDHTNCLWWDDLHPAAPIQKELAKGYADAMKDIGFL